MFKVFVAAGAVSALAACSSGVHASAPPNADINKIVGVKSSFGTEFTLKDIPEQHVGAEFFAARTLPSGLSFDPPECAKQALGPAAPPNLQGRMVAVSAEGDGNRFVVIAVQTSTPVPINNPGHHCGKVTFTARNVRGSIETVDTPGIEGAQTLGVHRVLQALAEDSARNTELYHYSAQFGNYEVIVIATPLADVEQSAAPVDAERARDLLVKGVAAVRP